MPLLLCDRLRQALRDFKHAAAHRAKLELETETGFKERSQVLEKEYQEQLRHIEKVNREAVAEAEHEVQNFRTRTQAQFDGEEARATEELDKAKKGAIKRYVQGKEQALADFKEARWTTTTIYDAGRKVAKDQLGAAQTKAKETVETLQDHQHSALLLMQRWQFANDLPLMNTPSPRAGEDDPWAALQSCLLQGTGFLKTLRSQTLPDHVRGWRPFVVLVLLWMLTCLPALFLAEWNVIYWLIAATAAIWPIGLFIRWWLKARARTQAVYLWGGLAQALTDATQLRPRCLDLARQTYRQQRKENKRRNEESLSQAAADTKTRVQTLRQDRSQKLRQAQASYEPHLKKMLEWRTRELAKAETNYRDKLAEFKGTYERALRELNERFKKAREDTNRRHADDWTQLVGMWKQGCDKLFNACRGIEQETRRWFPPWNAPAWDNWQLPQEVPLGLQMGQYDVRLEDIPHGIPTEAHLQRPDLSTLFFPILLPFPEKASLLLRAHDAGKVEGIEALQSLLLRCWTALPAGKARCTIIDPVGRGENFAAFMHLADHDESLVNSRIWTEAAHIEQRLADLTAHMENVLQKYLRNQYETLAEYNAQAGEVAEPYRFLVVADFPVNFTPDAARRLISLAGAGARCGIYTFIMLDLRQPMPHGIEQADLERVCTIFTWKNGHFGWNDPDFGSFPMELEKPPDAQTCTKLLEIAGQEAKNAGRVEVPFELIAPPTDQWWQNDSRLGISVPLGRVGATARQILNLGQGTSQHVLIAGKTGSGKSTLLHVLIAQLAMRYSPSEVELYLVDFKKGVEFKTYAVHELPHARVIAVESEREFGMSVLQRLDAELIRRGELFRMAGVNDLPSFRTLQDSNETNGKPHPVTLPRLVLIVDEFQEFFVEDDKIAQESALLLDRLVRQGRAFGIHILLGSQTLGGAYSLARSTIDQMAVRIALQCSEADAHLILSKDNSEARLLTRPGEGIYNSSGGLLEGNHFFQVVWLSDNQRDSALRQVHRFAQERSVKVHQIVFEGTSPSNLLKNPLLAQALIQPLSANIQAPLQAWLGEAVSIKDPTTALFRRQSGCNLLIVGQQDQAAFSILVAALVSLGVQLPKGIAGLFQLVVGHPLEQEAETVHSLLPEVLPIQVVTQRELPNLLNQLTEETNRRLKGETDGPPQFLILYGLQRLRDLRRPEDDFSFARKGETAVSPFKQLMNLLREGPPQGIFSLVWCDTLTNLQRTFDRPSLRELEMRVLFQMSPTDSSTLMDTPLAAKLGMNRALFYTEDQGRLEKFRPYALPPLEWLQELGQKR